MKNAFGYFAEAVGAMKKAGTYKSERILISDQKSKIDTTVAGGVINMCANNYLGLSNNSEIIGAAKESYDKWGYGLSSVRFICGTQQPHKELEARMSHFLGMEDTILYSSCFDANGGLFEALLGENDVIISDELNHASIIDGIRLCKAEKLRYKNNNMIDLEQKLKAASHARIRMIVTDGVFSMDGIVANLANICDLAEHYDALVVVDDSHAVGFMGERGRGTHEACGVIGRVDILTGTFGKALGGAMGGYTSSKKEVIDLLRQKSRPYLFSNSLAPAIVGGAIKTLDLLETSTVLRERLHENTKYFRSKIEALGFDIIESDHPIVAIMLYDANIANAVASRLLELGVYVVGFSYPVVPMGKARIRVQISAAHTKTELSYVADCLKRVKEEMKI